MGIKCSGGTFGCSFAELCIVFSRLMKRTSELATS